MTVDPYITPRVTHVETSCAAAGFVTIPSFNRKSWGPFLVALSVSGSAGLWANASRIDAWKLVVATLLFPGLGLVAVFLIRSWALSLDRAVGEQPLARSGQASAGGVAWQGSLFRKKRGFLFVTLDEVVFLKPGGAGGQDFRIAVPFASLAVVILGRVERCLQLQLHSGEIWTFVVNQPGTWLNAIERARRDAGELR